MKPNNPMLKRAAWHDYRSRCIYMVTLTKARGIADFSQISNTGNSNKAIPCVSLSPIGKIVDEEVAILSREYPSLKILNFSIMPDHIHLLIFITERTAEHLSQIVRVLKWNCNRRLTALLASETTKKMFSEGFNDKIVRAPGQKDNFYRYIKDNPRRLLARRLFPEYFRRINTFDINGEAYSLYGNIFLINNPWKTIVRYSSKFTPEETKVKEREYGEAFRTGAVLISPFIHDYEKQIMKRGIDAGCSLIRIMTNGFTEKFKPSGAEFTLCEEGKLLLIAPQQFVSQNFRLKRDLAMHANSIAEHLASLPLPVL